MQKSWKKLPEYDLHKEKNFVEAFVDGYQGSLGEGVRMAKAKLPGRLETDYCEGRSGLCEIIDPNLDVVKSGI